MQAIEASLSKVNVSKAAKPIKPCKYDGILPLLISFLLAAHPYRNCILILTLRPRHNSLAHRLKTLRQGLSQGWGAKGDITRAARGSNKLTLVFKCFINTAVVRTPTLKKLDCCVRSKSWNNWIKSSVLERCPSHGHLFHKARNLTSSARLNDSQGCSLWNSFHARFTPNSVWNSKHLALYSCGLRWPEIFLLFKWGWYEILKSHTCSLWVESARHSNYLCYQPHAPPVKQDNKKKREKNYWRALV